jgi:hypothetical protein
MTASTPCGEASFVSGDERTVIPSVLRSLDPMRADCSNTVFTVLLQSVKATDRTAGSVRSTLSSSSPARGGFHAGHQRLAGMSSCINPQFWPVHGALTYLRGYRSPPDAAIMPR